MTIRFLTPEGMTPWLAKVAESSRVLAPRKEGKSVVFRQWTAEDGDPLLAKATISPKAVVLPPCETLVEYKTVKDENNLADVKLVLNAPIEAEPTLLFACRPCDTRGIVAKLFDGYKPGTDADAVPPFLGFEVEEKNIKEHHIEGA